MRNWILGALLAVISCSASAFAQAAAEGALTHALSSGMGSSIGSTLGRATNQMAGKLGQQVSNPGKLQKVPSTKTAERKPVAPPAGSPTSAPGGSLIASIQGGEAANADCASSSKTAQNPAQKQDPKPQADACSPATDNHPSVINLPAPK
ncbi:MAG TPA: hypothetical protein VF133_13480 [Terriglobales bacterium]